MSQEGIQAKSAGSTGAADAPSSAEARTPAGRPASARPSPSRGTPPGGPLDLNQMALFRNPNTVGLSSRGFHGPFPELEVRLFELLIAERQASPFAPLVVLVPTTRLLRYLKVRLLERAPGLINLHLHTFSSLVRALMPDIPRLGHSIGMPGMRLLATRVLQESFDRDSYFKDLRDHHGLPRSLLRVAAECERGGVTPVRLRELAAREEKWRADKLNDLATFLQGYLELRDRGGNIDEVALEQRAAQAAASSSLGRTARAVVLYGFDELTPTMENLVDGVTRAGAPLYAFVPHHGPAPLDALQAGMEHTLLRHKIELERLEHSVPLPPTIAHLRRHLFEGPVIEHTVTPLAESLQVLSAPDPAGEVRAMAREIMALRTAGHSYEDMLVAFRRSDVYASLVEELFTEYQIPFQMGLSIPLKNVPIIRAFRCLVELIQADLSRDTVMELLCSPYFHMSVYLPDRFREADVFMWDSLTRFAGVTRGAHSWEAGLKRLHRWKMSGLDNEDGRLDYESRKIRRQAGLLERVIHGLRGDLEKFPFRGQASSYVGLLRGLLDRLIDPTAGARMNPRDRDGLNQLRSALREMESLDRLSPELTWEEFKTLLEDILNESSLRETEVATGGVQVMDLPSIRGLSADFVFIGGVVEGMLPAREGTDPVLLAEERGRLNKRGARLEVSDSSGRTEKVLFSLAVNAARRRLTLTLHRLDGTGRETLQSSYLRELWKTFYGIAVFQPEFKPGACFREERPDRIEAGDWSLDWELGLIRYARHAEGDAELANAQLTLAAWLAKERDRKRAFQAEYMRWLPDHFTEFDGQLGPVWAFNPSEAVLSASRLELVGSCPFRYLADAVWGLSPLGEPEGARQVDSRPKGELYHRILFELLERWRLDDDYNARFPKADDAMGEAERLTEQLLVEFEQEKPTGYFALWAEDRRQITRDIVEVIKRELSRGSGFVPYRLERAFGDQPVEQGGGAEPLPALKIRVEELGELSVRGRIDRLDLDPVSRRAQVLDYKTGKARSKSEVRKQVERGALVQLPLYLAAARALLPEGYQIEGFYYYYITERRGGFSRAGLTFEELEALQERVQQTLKVLGNILRGGTFFPWPDEDVCRYCDFKLICRRSPEARFREKVKDPLVAEFVKLRQPGEE